MAIKDEIETRQRQARRDRDERTLNVIGLLKNKVLLELKSGSGATEDDVLWRQVLESYAKGVKKAMPEFEKAGERGVEALDEARFELRFCESFLPSKLDEAGTEALVRKLATEHGITKKAEIGKLMGLLMKGHKDEIDGALARTVAQRVLVD
jgi:uncharacterized protein